MAFQQSYPFDLRKFPDEDDILLTEADLKRKNVIYCRKEVLQQMKCTQWAKDEYLAADKDPENHNMWFHYHLQKCYTPYMDAVGCLVSLKDKEIQKMKREAGPKGWKQLEQRWVHDMARKVGENQAKKMWEMSTNMKEMFEKMRQRDGHLYGEQRSTNNDTTATATSRGPPMNIADAMGASELLNKNTPISNPSHDDIEALLVRAKRYQLKLEREREEAKAKKSIWSFGSYS